VEVFFEECEAKKEEAHAKPAPKEKPQKVKEAPKKVEKEVKENKHAKGKGKADEKKDDKKDGKGKASPKAEAKEENGKPSKKAQLLAAKMAKKEQEKKEKAEAEGKKGEAKREKIAVPLRAAVEHQASHITKILKRPLHHVSLRPAESSVLSSEETEVEGQGVRVYLCRPALVVSDSALARLLTSAGYDAAAAVDARLFLTSKDWFSVKQRAGHGKSPAPVSVRAQLSTPTGPGKAFEALLGRDFFLSVQDALDAQKK